MSAKAKEQFLRFVQQNPRPESGISISRDLWQGNPTDVLPDAIEILRKAGFKFVDAKTCLGLENIYEPAEGRDLNALTLPDLKPRWADKSVACEVHLNLAK